MNKATMMVTVGIVAVLGLGGGGYALKRQSDSNKAHEAFMMHEAAMKKKDAETVAMKKTEEAAAMKKAELAKSGDAVKHDEAVVTKGSYISYADYSSNQDKYKDYKVVLNFHAPWCPTCQALDKSINANLDGIPAKTVIVKTDYDSSNDLKKKYGVTYQHTMVQIDASGNKLKKWSGSPELKDLLAEIQA